MGGLTFYEAPEERTGADLEKYGLELTPSGRRWRDFLEKVSFKGSPLQLLCDPLTRKLWRCYAEMIRNRGRRATGTMRQRYELIEMLALRMPDESVAMDLLNWLMELEENGITKLADGHTRGLARDAFELDFVQRELIEGKGVGR